MLRELLNLLTALGPAIAVILTEIWLTIAVWQTDRKLRAIAAYVADTEETITQRVMARLATALDTDDEADDGEERDR